MKNILLVITLSMFVFGVSAQISLHEAQNIKIHVNPSDKVEYTGNEIGPSANPAAANNGARSAPQPQDIAGGSTYDLQTNNSVCRRIWNSGSGEIITTYTGSTAGSLAAPDRGTGYNYFNGTTWQTPTPASYPGRIENQRTGWPNLAVTASGREVVVSHTVSAGLNMSWRTVGSGAAWQSKVIAGDPDAVWPRMANSGDSLYVIVSRARADGDQFNGLDGGLALFRSWNGGDTWIGPDSIPGLNANNFPDLGGDAYAIDASGSTVAFVCGTFQPTLFKSTDAGATWTKTIIQAISDPLFSGQLGETLDSVVTGDESYSILVDQTGKAHVWYGRNIILDPDPATAGWFFFPGNGGLMYWNEDMTEHVLIPNTAPNAEQLDVCFAFYTNTNPDWAQSYFNAIVSMPSAGIDAAGNIYVTYSALRGLIFDGLGNATNIDINNLMFRNVYAIKSMDGGATWLGPYNVSKDSVEEAVYASLARNVDTDCHIVYQSDNDPGTSVQTLAGDGDYDLNSQVYLKFPVGAIVNPVDITCPTIAISAGQPGVIATFEGCPFDFSRLFAFDVPDGNITHLTQLTPAVDYNVPGTYNGTGAYVIDMAGNSSDTISIDVIVVPDNTAPTITLIGPDTLDVLLSTTYTDPGATVTDNACSIQDSLVIDQSAVNTLVPGTYVVTFDVTDNAGNIATQVLRYVNVIGADTKAPVITLVGNSTITIEACDTNYVDAGATAFDNIDFDVTSSIVVTDNIDFFTPGSYSVTYSVSDNAGNMAMKMRTIIIVDNTSPIITLNGMPLVYHYLMTTYTDAGATAKDCVDGNLTSGIVVSSNVDANTRGAYQVTYNVMDAATNAATQLTRTVQVGTEPAAEFAYVVLPGNAATFSDQSQWNPTSWSWDFGDGTPVNTLKNPNHTFATASTFNVCLTSANAFGTSTQVCKMVNAGNVGINDIKLASLLKVYPNPTKGFVNVEFSSNQVKDFQLSLINVLGEQVMTPVNHQLGSDKLITLDVSNIPSGVYLIKITTDKDIVVKKLTIE